MNFFLGAGVIFALGVIVVVVLLVVAKNNSSTTTLASKDVMITGCATNSAGFVEASGTIVNHSSQRSNYVITVAIDDARATRLGEGAGAETNINPGHTALFHTLLAVHNPPAGFTCKLADATRLASEG